MYIQMYTYQYMSIYVHIYRERERERSVHIHIICIETERVRETERERSNILYPIWKYVHLWFLSPPSAGPSAHGAGRSMGLGGRRGESFVHYIYIYICMYIHSYIYTCIYVISVRGSPNIFFSQLGWSSEAGLDTLCWTLASQGKGCLGA